MGDIRNILGFFQRSYFMNMGVIRSILGFFQRSYSIYAKMVVHYDGLGFGWLVPGRRQAASCVLAHFPLHLLVKAAYSKLQKVGIWAKL